MNKGIELIAKERQRQIEAEGWDKQHDSSHTEGELALAAAYYAIPAASRWAVKELWPFGEKWFKPSPQLRIKELAKAGALIAAEIDRRIEAENAIYRLRVEELNKESKNTVVMPRTLTVEDGFKGGLIGEFFEEIETLDPETDEEFIQKIPVSWSTIKGIYKRVVELVESEGKDE